MKFQTRRKRKVIINITSLIDVLFLMLIFLMVSSTFLEQPGIKLELPQADSAAMVEKKDYTLFVDKEGKMFLNESEVSLQELETRIKKALPEMKESALILKADQSVSHGIVVKAMDVARRSGVKKLVIGTRLDQ